MIERAAVVAKGPLIEPDDLGSKIANKEEQRMRTFAEEKRRVIEKFEREYLEKLMAENGQNVALAAAAAGKDERTWRKLLRKQGMPRDGRNVRSEEGNGGA